MSFGQRHAPHFLPRREVHDREPVEVGDLHEQPLGRSVGVLLEGDRPHALVEERPHRLLGLGVDHGHQAPRNRARDDVLAVGRDVHVVDAALGRDRLHALERSGVDDVHRARRRDDADVDAAAVAADRDVVGTARQRNLLRRLQRLRVHDVQRLLGLAAEVQPAPVGRRGRAVIDRHVRDFADDAMRRRIDEVHVVGLARVGLDDPHLGPCRRRNESDQHSCDEAGLKTRGHALEYFDRPHEFSLKCS